MKNLNWTAVGMLLFVFAGLVSVFHPSVATIVVWVQTSHFPEILSLHDRLVGAAWLAGVALAAFGLGVAKVKYRNLAYAERYAYLVEA